MRTQEAVDRVNEAIDHLNERLPFKDIIFHAVSWHHIYGGITSVPVFGFTHFEIDDVEIEKNSKVGLTRLVKQRLLTVLDGIRDSVHKVDSAVEPKIFSGMSFEEIQTVADTMLSSDKHASTDDLIMLITNLAARMKEKE